MTKVEAVLLDVGGVLLTPHAEPVSAALAGFGITVTDNEAERAHFEAVATIDDFTNPDAVEGYLPAYAAAVGVHEPMLAQAVQELERLWAQPSLHLWRQTVQGTTDGLRALTQAGVRLGVISNSDGTVEEQLLTQEICQIGSGAGVEVELIVDSFVVGFAKPAVEIFLHAVNFMGLLPEQVLYVGDTVRYDVLGAEAAGLKATHFDPYRLCNTTSHSHLRQLKDLRAQLFQT